MKKIKVNEISFGNDQPFVLIAGLNVLEDEKTIEDVISKCISSTKKLGIPYIFKASYDKANRSSVDSFRGPGVERGLQILSDLKQDYDVTVISDIHTPHEAELAAEVLDLSLIHI